MNPPTPLNLPDPDASDAIVVFDGVCAVCSGWVGFLLRHDRARQFRFAAMQDDAGRMRDAMRPGDTAVITGRRQCAFPP